MKKKRAESIGVEVVAELVCDLCGAETVGDDWSKFAHDVCEVKVELRTGEVFDCAGNVKTTSFDICPKCFKEKVVPALEALGANPSVTEDYW